MPARWLGKKTRNLPHSALINDALGKYEILQEDAGAKMLMIRLYLLVFYFLFTWVIFHFSFPIFFSCTCSS